MKRAAFHTLGCKVNQYETEALINIFENAGYEIVDFDSGADVYVINTCTVTGLSARKSRQMIRRAKIRNSNSIVVVTGCYSQTQPQEVLDIPDVDLVMGTAERGKIVELISQIEAGASKINNVRDIMKVREYEPLNVTEYKGRTRAFLKIQEGCTQYCSYCIIPYARGPVRSRKLPDIMGEVLGLAQKGFKEIVLTGIHIASYGRDLGNICLMDAIKAINSVEGIERIRIGSIEPTTITHEFIDEAVKLPKLCPHYHISLQSGCDETLRRMNRRYSTSDYKKVVELIRNNIKDAALTTDVMVGFPGETEQEFKATFDFLEEIGFSKMHIFKYSPRKGTPAADFPNQIRPEVKEERSRILIDLSDRKAFEFNKRYEGKTLPVLFEQKAPDMPGFIEGLTPNYIRAVASGDEKLCGSILQVKLEIAEKDHMMGSLC